MGRLGAVGRGGFWQQTACVGHDIGDNSITHNRATDYLLGAANVALFGVSLSKLLRLAEARDDKELRRLMGEMQTFGRNFGRGDCTGDRRLRVW